MGLRYVLRDVGSSEAYAYVDNRIPKAARAGPEVSGGSKQNRTAECLEAWSGRVQGRNCQLAAAAGAGVGAGAAGAAGAAETVLPLLSRESVR